MNAWVCDRCSSVSRSGDVDDPPAGWVFVHRPIRGSEGARSNSTGIICDDCDDLLYEWWNPRLARQQARTYIGGPGLNEHVARAHRSEAAATDDRGAS